MKNMEAQKDELDEGSIPDLTEVCLAPDPGGIRKENYIMKNMKRSSSSEEDVEQECVTGKKFKETREKMQDTCGKICSDIKTALNASYCFDHDQEKGIYKDLLFTITYFL